MENPWISLINCVVNLVLNCFKKCFIPSNVLVAQATLFEITNARLYVQDVTLLIEDNA